MNRILVTGASGFVGFHVARNLIQAGYEVVAPVRKPAIIKEQIIELRAMGIEIVEGNFYDDVTLSKVFEKPVDVIAHFAAVRGEQNISAHIYDEVNIHGTQKLIEYAKQHRTPNLIYCSSVGVYGTIPIRQPATTLVSLKPDNHYHRSKLAAERLVTEACSDNMSVCVLRPTILYGKYDDGFLPKLVRMVEKKQFVLPIKPVKIHLLSVDAFAELICDLVREGKLDNQIYNVADSQNIHLSDLVDYIHDKIFKRLFPAYLKIPGFIFAIARFLLQSFGRAGLLTSVQLISQSWTYDISTTIKKLNFKPADTFDTIPEVIQGIIDEKQ